jgi:hypothetical protein
VARPLTAPRPLVVEFVGLPGVGKSHLTRVVARRLAAVGTPVRSPALRVNHELGTFRRVLYKFGVSAAEMLRRPGYAVHIGRELMRSGQQRRVDVVRLSYNWFFLVGLLRRARSQPIVELLDEGTVQLLWSIGFDGDERAMHERSSNLLSGSALPMPDVVVVVEAPLVLIQSRLESRRSRAGRLDRMESAQRQAALVRGTRLLGEVLSEEVGVLGNTSGPLLRRVRNGNAVEFRADVDALVAELASLAAR